MTPVVCAGVLKHGSSLVVNSDREEAKARGEEVVLVRGSKEKALGCVLATEKSEAKRPPNAFLRLERVFGMRSEGKGCVQYLCGERKAVVYCVSKYVIVESPVDNLQKVYDKHEYKVTCFICSSAIIVSADVSGAIHFWSPKTMELQKTMKLPIEEAMGEYMDMSADEKLLLIIMRPSQSLLVIDWRQDREMAFKSLGSDLVITEAKFDPIDSSRIVAIGKQIVEFRLTLGSITVVNYCPIALRSPEDSVLFCMDFLAPPLNLDGEVQSDVYIGTSGGEVGVLIEDQFEVVTAGPIHSGPINSIRIVKDMSSPVCIITAGDDNAVRLWDISFNLITAINIAELSIYTSTQSKQYTGSGIPSTHLNGIYSLDILKSAHSKYTLLAALRCGDTLELELETELYTEHLEESATHRKLFKAPPKSTLMLRHHTSNKVCAVPIEGTSFLATSGDDSTLRLWNVVTNYLVWTEDLGKARGLKVSCLGYSAIDSLLVVGFRSGMVVYYKLVVADFVAETEKAPRIVLKCSTHDSVGPVLKIAFSGDCDLLAVSHGPNMLNEGAGVFVYQRNELMETRHKNIKEAYTKIKWIEIPMGNLEHEKGLTHAPVDLEFSADNTHLQLCYLPLTKTGQVLYNAEPACIIWDLQKDSVAEDWSKLRNVLWNNFAFAPAVLAQSFPLMQSVVFTCVRPLGEDLLALVCAGSTRGDVHIFRRAAILADKSGVGSGEKAEGALAKSQSACCSYIDSLHVIGREEEKWLIVTAADDGIVVKYKVVYEDYKSNLDYLLLEPREIAEDPFKEFPSKSKLKLLFYDDWRKRHQAADEMPHRSSIELKANWVFGRRAFDRRNNLKFDYLGRAVYSVGTMLILVNESIRSFASGEKSRKKPIEQIILNSTSENPAFPEISCIAMSRSRRLVAFGTSEAQAHIYVWDISTNTETAMCPVDAASLVTALKLHCNERYAAVLALSKEHIQIILIVDTMEGVELCRATQIHSLPFKIRDIDFCPDKSYTTFVTCGIQHLSFWHINAKYMLEESAAFASPHKASLVSPEQESKFNESAHSGLAALENRCGALAVCKGLEGEEGVYASFLAMGFVGQTMLTVADDGFVYIWRDKHIVNKRQGHSGPVLSLHIHESNELVVTGGADGRVVLWSFNEKSVHGHANLEKIRSIRCPFEGVEKCVQSVAVNAGLLVIGTQTGSSYVVNVVDGKGNIKPKQSGVEVFEPFLKAIDNERLRSIAYDPLNDRLYCLAESGLFVAMDVETQQFLHSDSYPSRGLAVDILKTTGDEMLGRLMLAFENEVIFLTDKYEQLPGMTLKKTNITAAKVSDNNLYLAVGSVGNGDVEVAVYKIADGLDEMHSRREYTAMIISLDFTTDDNYLFVLDELGNTFIYEVEHFHPVKEASCTEAELEWQSWGLKSDADFSTVAKHYSQNNRISAVARTQGNMVAVGDQSGIVDLVCYV